MNKWYIFMSFTMQNYNKYFNVASDINIFLIIVYFILKIVTLLHAVLDFAAQSDILFE